MQCNENMTRISGRMQNDKACGTECMVMVRVSDRAMVWCGMVDVHRNGRHGGGSGNG